MFLFQDTPDLTAAPPPVTAVTLLLLMLSVFDVRVQNLFHASVGGHDGRFGERLFHSGGLLFPLCSWFIDALFALLMFFFLSHKKNGLV